MPEICPFNCVKGRIFDAVTHSFVSCPHCSGVLSELTSAKKEENTQEVDLLEKLCIPNNYRDATFNPDTFFGNQSRRTFASSTFAPFLEKLVSVEDAIKRSRVLSESCYFYCGVPDAENMFAYVYYILRLALKHGLSAVPFASLMDLHEVRRMTPETSKLYTNLTWYDYTTADVCFLCSTAKASDSEFILLADLLQERARRGLSTYVVGYWTRDTLRKQKATITYLFSDDKSHLSLMSYYGVQTERAVREANGDTTYSRGRYSQRNDNLGGYTTGNTGYTTVSTGLLNALSLAGDAQPATFGLVDESTSSGLGTTPAKTEVPEQPSSNLMGVSPKKYGYDNIGGSTK